MPLHLLAWPPGLRLSPVDLPRVAPPVGGEHFNIAIFGVENRDTGIQNTTKGLMWEVKVTISVFWQLSCYFFYYGT